MSPTEAQRPITRVLSDIAHVLQSDQNTEERVQHVLELLRQLVPYDRCALFAVTAEGGNMLIAPGSEEQAIGPLRLMLEQLGGLLLPEEITLQTATGWISADRSEHWASRLAVPLVGLDEAFGVLAVGRAAADAYREDDLYLLSIVASQMAAYLTATGTRKRQLEREQAARASAQEEARRLALFLAELSNGLRNFLAPIAAAAQLMSRRRDDLTQQEATAVIDRQVSEMVGLLDELREIISLMTGNMELRSERIEVSRIVAEAVDATRSMIDQRQQELTLSMPDEPLWVRGDLERLKLVVVNLLSNAAKYTESGGRIWLTVQRGGDDAVIRVRDTGVGVGSELLPHVFDLFTRIEQPLHRPQDGLGIGLALVRGVVELHGGTVEAISEGFGKGSEFVVHLPAASQPLEVSMASTAG